MNTITKKIDENTLKTSKKSVPKKYSEAQKNKIIKELAEITNRNMTRKYLMDLALGRR